MAAGAARQAQAQGAPAAPAAKPAGTKAPRNGPGRPAAPRLTVPSPENILILIRSTLLGLHHAMETGNYTVLRDLASPSFREVNSAGHLYQLFAVIRAQGVSLAAVAILAPKMQAMPAIDKNGHLRITGYYPGNPVQLNFDLLFVAMANQWRLLGINVTPAPSAPMKPLAEDTSKAGRPKAQKR